MSNFKKDFLDFLNKPWQEDNEIAVIEALNQYKKQIVSDEQKGKDYIKRFVDANTKAINLSCSEQFQMALADLLGESQEELRKPADSMTEAVKKPLKEAAPLTRGQIVHLKGGQKGEFRGIDTTKGDRQNLIKMPNGEHKFLRRGIDFWTDDDLEVKKAEKGKKATSPKVIERWEEQLAQLDAEIAEFEEELKQVHIDQEQEAGHFQQIFGNNWYHEWESAGKHDEYGGRMQEVEDHIDALKNKAFKLHVKIENAKDSGVTPTKELTYDDAIKMSRSYNRNMREAKELHSENYLYTPTKDFKYLVQSTMGGSAYSGGDYPKMYFNSEESAKNFIEHVKEGKLEYKGIHTSED